MKKGRWIRRPLTQARGVQRCRSSRAQTEAKERSMLRAKSSVRSTRLCSRRSQSGLGPPPRGSSRSAAAMMVSTPLCVRLLWLMCTSSMCWQARKISRKSSPAASSSWLLNSLRIRRSGQRLHSSTMAPMLRDVMPFRERSNSVYLVGSLSTSRSIARATSPSPKLLFERFRARALKPLPPPLPPSGDSPRRRLCPPASLSRLAEASPR